MAETFSDLGFQESQPPTSFADLGFTPVQEPRAAKRAALVAQQKELESTPDPSLADLFFKETSAPFIDLPKPTISTEDSALTKAGKGVVQSLVGAAETLESPLGASVAALSFLPGVGAAVAATAGVGFGASGLYQGIKQMWNAVINRDPAEAGRGMGNVIAGGAAIGGVAARALPKPEPTLTPKTDAAVAVTENPNVTIRIYRGKGMPPDMATSDLAEAKKYGDVTFTDVQGPRKSKGSGFTYVDENMLSTFQPLTEDAAISADKALVKLPGEEPGVASAPKAPEAAPQPAPEPRITSLKNAVVDDERGKRGLDPAEPVLKQTFGAAWDQAMQKIEKDAKYQDDLISELRTKPRALTDVEDAALLQRQVDLQNQYEVTQKDLIEAADKGDQVAQVEAKARFNVLSDQLLDLYNVGKKAGTETARGLAARRMLSDEQFNLTSMITEKRAANGGRRLTEPETKEITTLKDKIDASQQAIDQYQAEHFDRPPTKLDEEFLRLQAENIRLKTRFKQDIQNDLMKDRNPALKFADFWTKWRRFQLLSGPRTLGKLTAAAALRMAITPVKEVIGAGIGKILPGEIAEGARIQGGFSIRGEANAITQFFTQGMQDAWQTLRTGVSDLELVYGKLHALEPSVLDFFGHLHGALKAPLKRAAFARAFAKGIEFDMRNGVDVTDPMVQTKNAVLAYKEAQRAIFMEDNRLVDGFNAGLRTLERPSKTTGETPLGSKAVATAVRTELPIVRVPSNIVAQAFEHAFGLVTGSVRLAAAYRKGFEKLTEPEKELILRELKSGSVGGTMLLLGFLNPEVIGGYYQHGEKRDKADVKPGGARLYDVDIPASAMHEPSLEVLQLGSTVRRVADSKLRKKDEAAQGIAAGALAGGLSLIEESPFIRDIFDVQKAFDPNSRNAFFGELAKSLVVPQALQQIATEGIPFTGGAGGDVDAAGEPIKRQPQGIIEHIESGVPGLREDLKKKEEKKKGAFRNTFSIKK